MDILVNSKTGELKTVESPFRSITDLKGYDDAEHYEPGTSQVDLTGYEPLASIVARCTRVVRAPGGQSYQVIDKDLLRQESTMDGVYEAAGATSIDEAFASQDVTDMPTFDLADASAISEQMKSAHSTELPTSASEEQLDIKQAMSEPVVDNSEPQPDLDEKK